jgi:hypothetical protein
MTDAEIERTAEEVLAAHEIRGLPVDPFQIAKLENIKLLPGDYDGCFDGRIEYRRKNDRGVFYLFYAKEERPWGPEGRVRFSVGHELGHYFLPEHREYLLSGVWHGSHAGFVSDKRTEREADQFSASLLMPRRRFIERVKLHSRGVCTLRDLVNLADNVFKTSITSTAIRYAQLNFEPCCVVLSNEDGVLYSIRSEDLKRQGLGWIERGSAVPSTSVTGKFHAATAAGNPGRAEGSVTADVWFDGRQPRRLWEEVKPLGRTGLTFTYLVLDEEDD